MGATTPSSDIRFSPTEEAEMQSGQGWACLVTLEPPVAQPGLPAPSACHTQAQPLGALSRCPGSLPTLPSVLCPAGCHP